MPCRCRIGFGCRSWPVELQQPLEYRFKAAVTALQLEMVLLHNRLRCRSAIRLLQQISQFDPARPADFGCGANGLQNRFRNGIHDLEVAGHLGFVQSQGILYHRPAETAVNQVAGKESPFDEREIAPFGIFLALRHHKLGIAQLTDDRLHRQLEFRRRPQTAMAVGGLVVPPPLRMRPDENGNLLAIQLDALDQFPERLVKAEIVAQPVFDKRILNKLGINLDDPFRSLETFSNLAGILQLTRDPMRTGVGGEPRKLNF